MNDGIIRNQTKTELLQAFARRHERRFSQPAKVPPRGPLSAQPGAKTVLPTRAG